MPTLKVIHIAKSLKNLPHEPKLVKEYAFANASKFAEIKPVGNRVDGSAIK
jgi:hypothetical protein